MNVFISYSTEDKIIAGSLCAQLVAHGIHSFLAHDEIQIADDWKAKILQELNFADAMIALLSINFLSSAWTGHELGYFYAKSGHKGLVIPISLDGTVSCGMFQHIQSQRLPSGSRSVPVGFWLAPLYSAFPDHILRIIIEKLADCSCFRTCEEYMRILGPHYGSMDKASLDRLVSAATNNPCIFSARECRNTNIPGLVKVNTGRLSPVQIADLQQRLNSDETFRSRLILPASTMAEGEHGK